MAATQTTIESAVTALFKYKAKQSSSEKLQLLPQDDYVYLNITLKNIPSNTRTNPFRIPLPHPIMDPTSELCLIIDDRPNTPTPPSDQIKKLVKNENIPVSKVIKLSKLKTNYKPFEAKRKLCDSYDMFLVDKRIVHLLPKLIGKEFFKKKKLPLGVDLGKRNLKVQVEKALGSALLYLRSGTCCVVKVGKVAMGKDEIVENVLDAINGAVEMVPRKWEGVRSLHLKFSDSVALPVYQALPDVRLKSEGTEEGKVSDSEGECKESSGKKIGNNNKMKKKKNKGRIHEVRYMDVEDDIVHVDLKGSELVREDDVDEVLGDVEIDEDLKDDKIVGKKRKLREEKKLNKKKAKVDESELEKPKKNDGIESVEKKPKKNSEEGVPKKSKKTDGTESGEIMPKKKSEKRASKKSTKTDGIESGEIEHKEKSDDDFAKKSKKTDGVESGETKPMKKSDEGVAKMSKKTDGIESGETKPKKKSEEGIAKKSKMTNGMESGKRKPKKKTQEGIAKKSKKTDGLESGEIKPKKKSEKGGAKKIHAMDSAEKKGKKKGELEKKLKGVAKVKDVGKQKKRVSFK